jgi:hypothetical protein
MIGMLLSPSLNQEILQALVESIKTVKSFGVIVIGLMPSNTPLSRICDISLDIDVGENARLT